nr:antibiotic biosynthesis monooxygenase [Marinomonas atlantica]
MPSKQSLSTLAGSYFATAELEITDTNRIEETRTAIHELCRQTRNELGCYLFEVHECTEEPTKLMLWECFATEADFHKHHAMPYTQAYMERGLTEVVRLHHSHLMS